MRIRPIVTGGGRSRGQPSWSTHCPFWHYPAPRVRNSKQGESSFLRESELHRYNSAGRGRVLCPVAPIQKRVLLQGEEALAELRQTHRGHRERELASPKDMTGSPAGGGRGSILAPAASCATHQGVQPTSSLHPVATLQSKPQWKGQVHGERAATLAPSQSAWAARELGIEAKEPHQVVKLSCREEAAVWLAGRDISFVKSYRGESALGGRKVRLGPGSGTHHQRMANPIKSGGGKPWHLASAHPPPPRAAEVAGG